MGPSPAAGSNWYQCQALLGGWGPLLISWVLVSEVSCRVQEQHRILPGGKEHAQVGLCFPLKVRSPELCW